MSGVLPAAVATATGAPTKPAAIRPRDAAQTAPPPPSTSLSSSATTSTVHAAGPQSRPAQQTQQTQRCDSTSAPAAASTAPSLEAAAFPIHLHQQQSRHATGANLSTAAQRMFQNTMAEVRQMPWAHTVAGGTVVVGGGGGGTSKSHSSSNPSRRSGACVDTATTRGGVGSGSGGTTPTITEAPPPAMPLTAATAAAATRSRRQPSPDLSIASGHSQSTSSSASSASSASSRASSASSSSSKHGSAAAPPAHTSRTTSTTNTSASASRAAHGQAAATATANGANGGAAPSASSSSSPRPEPTDPPSDPQGFEQWLVDNHVLHPRRCRHMVLGASHMDFVCRASRSDPVPACSEYTNDLLKHHKALLKFLGTTPGSKGSSSAAKRFKRPTAPFLCQHHFRDWVGAFHGRRFRCCQRCKRIKDAENFAIGATGVFNKRCYACSQKQGALRRQPKRGRAAVLASASASASAAATAAATTRQTPGAAAAAAETATATASARRRSVPRHQQQQYPAAHHGNHAAAAAAAAAAVARTAAHTAPRPHKRQRVASSASSSGSLGGGAAGHFVRSPLVAGLAGGMSPHSSLSSIQGAAPWPLPTTIAGGAPPMHVAVTAASGGRPLQLPGHQNPRHASPKWEQLPVAGDQVLQVEGRLAMQYYALRQNGETPLVWVSGEAWGCSGVVTHCDGRTMAVRISVAPTALIHIQLLDPRRLTSVSPVETLRIHGITTTYAIGHPAQPQLAYHPPPGSAVGPPTPTTTMRTATAPPTTHNSSSSSSSSSTGGAAAATTTAPATAGTSAVAAATSATTTTTASAPQAMPPTTSLAPAAHVTSSGGLMTAAPRVPTVYTPAAWDRWHLVSAPSMPQHGGATTSTATTGTTNPAPVAWLPRMPQPPSINVWSQPTAAMPHSQPAQQLTQQPQQQQRQQYHVAAAPAHLLQHLQQQQQVPQHGKGSGVPAMPHRPTHGAPLQQPHLQRYAVHSPWSAPHMARGPVAAFHPQSS